MADFFNKVKQGIGKGVATASVKSKEVLDATKIKSQIRELEDQKKAMLGACPRIGLNDHKTRVEI